jgi:TolB-like protein/DNA-binding winged helix-turn-helix (wHTH) protein
VNSDFRVGPWLVQPSLNTISQNGTSNRVERKMMEVLVCLAEHTGEVVPKEKLLQTVWPDTFVSDDVLKRSVSELRHVFGDDAHDSRVIQTIPRRGYRLVAAVHRTNGVPLVRPTELPGATETDSRRRSRLGAVGGVLGLIALMVACAVTFNVAGIREWLLPSLPTASIHSLAVLPLASLSNDPIQEYFADGVTDALITDLAQISALKIVSRTTVMRYKKTDKPLPLIARELNVDGIVEGTVQRSGDRVRITAQLIYGPADRHLWAQSLERDMKDMLALQSTVASEIANEIQIKVTPEEQARLKKVRHVNPKALDAFVKARFHLDQAGKLEFYKDKRLAQQEEIGNAVSYLDRAMQEDPNYIPAYVAHFDLVDAANISRLEFLPKTKAALTKAVELDETSVEAHLALAKLLMQYEYDWSGAEREYRRAIQLNPNSAEAHAQYTDYLGNVGRATDSRKERELAQALDPAHDYRMCIGPLRCDYTVDQNQGILDLMASGDPFAIGTQAKDYAIAGRYRESVDMWERCLSMYGWHDFVQVLKHADAKGGPKFAMREWMRAAEEHLRSHDNFPVFVMAFTYASLGDKDHAFEWLEKAVAQRNWCIIYLKVDDVWDPLRSDARFTNLLQRVGLPQ